MKQVVLKGDEVLVCLVAVKTMKKGIECMVETMNVFFDEDWMDELKNVQEKLQKYYDEEVR